MRIYPFSQTSHIVTWLTRNFGKITTVIKGALRPKSLFLGQYDLFHTCELLFYTRERNDLHIAKECAPVKTRSELRTDWRSACCASYVCDAVSRVSLHEHRQDNVFDLADLTLDEMCSGRNSVQIMFWFELKLLHALGLSPRFDRCTVCNAQVADRKPSLFSYEKGGLLCPACSEIEKSETTVIRPDTLAILRNWQKSFSARTASVTRCTDEQIDCIGRFLGIFLPYHLDFDRMPKSRLIVLKMLSLNRNLKTGD